MSKDNSVWDKIRNENCKDCELHKTAQSVCLIGRGPEPCDIMIVGEAPGFREDEIGKPFSGKAGQLLDDTLKKVGLKRKDIFITNAVHCRPPDNRTPSKKEIEICRQYLDQEIETVKPKFIMLMGNSALYGGLKKSGITKHRGRTYKKDGITYLATFHPAAILRQQSRATVFNSDFKKFSRLIETGGNIEPKFKWSLVNTPGKLKTCLRDLEEAEDIAFDTETSSLNMFAPEGLIHCIAIATEKCSWAIPLDHPQSVFKDQADEVMEQLYKACHNKSKDIATANGKFDNKWLRKRFNLRFNINHDTMLAHYILDENSPHGLKYLASTYLDAPDYDIDTKQDLAEVDIEELTKYCAYDAYYTLKLKQLFKRKLIKDRRLNRVYKDILMKCSTMYEEAEYHGNYINSVKLKLTEKKLLKMIKKSEKKLNKFIGREINWNSPQQVAEALFDDLELPVVAITKSNNPSTSSEEVLPYLLDEHPIIEELLHYRELVKLSQFAVAWHELVKESGDSRIHPTFKIHGTVTGRPSCTNPNLQQVPRDQRIRPLITAPVKEGWVLVEADYSQIELRVTAILADETTMKTAFQTGEDIHTKTAISITDRAANDVSKEERKKAKAVNFGFVYGMGANKFKKYARSKYNISMTDQEAKDFRQRFFELYYDLPDWHDRQRYLVNRYGYIRTPLGRIRRLPEVNSPDRALRHEAERQSINSPVQSAASDLNLIAATRIFEQMSRDQIKIVGTIHDAILMEVRKEFLDETLEQVESIMSDRKYIEERFGWFIPIPLDVEIEIGPWGKGKLWNK